MTRDNLSNRRHALDADEPETHGAIQGESGNDYLRGFIDGYLGRSYVTAFGNRQLIVGADGWVSSRLSRRLSGADRDQLVSARRTTFGDG